MQIKEFLEKKNYSDLLSELEQNFTFTPKTREWSLLVEVRRKYGDNARIVLCNREAWYDGDQSCYVAWMIMDKTFPRKILKEGQGLSQDSRVANDYVKRNILQEFRPENGQELPTDINRLFPE